MSTLKKTASDDEAFYLRGNVYRKMGDIRQALNNYLTAMELNPDSPAQTAYNAQIKILDFYNKDMFNSLITLRKSFNNRISASRILPSRVGGQFRIRILSFFVH